LLKEIFFLSLRASFKRAVALPVGADKPIFKKLKGWQCSTADCRKLSDLPENAMNYLRFLAELMEVPIAIVSLGANRDQTIVIEDPIHGPKRALLR